LSLSQTIHLVLLLRAHHAVGCLASLAAVTWALPDAVNQSRGARPWSGQAGVQIHQGLDPFGEGSAQVRTPNGGCSNSSVQRERDKGLEFLYATSNVMIHWIMNNYTYIFMIY
jgi:hypothetical protein